MGSDFTDGVRHAARDYFGIGLSQLCRASASVAGFSVLWFSTSSLSTALLAGCAAALLSALLLDLPKLRALQPLRRSGASRSQDGPRPSAEGSAHGTPAAYRALLAHALPLALVQFLNLGILYMPRMVLARQGSLDAVASYTCLATMVGIASLAAGSYAASLAPDFAAAGPAARSRLLSFAVRQIALGVVPVAALLTWFGPELLSLVFGKEIAFPAAAVAWMAVFGVLWSVATAFGTRATAERQTTLQVVAFGAALLVGSLACSLLVQPFEVAGATFSLVLSAVTLLAVYSLGQDLFPVLRRKPRQEAASVGLQSSPPCRSSLP
jgi:O-antigen/teichoic acid export membrane protein